MENVNENESTSNLSELSGVVDVAKSDDGIEKKGWIKELIERESIPKAERTETIEKFCERHGISESTYDYQRRKKENKVKVLEIWLNEAFYGGNSVLRKLKEKADDGDTKAIELYMKFILELAENLDVKSDGQKIVINQMFYGNSNTSQISSQTIPVTISPSDTESKV